ncbi:MAG: tetratricopeptide repeat protein [Deltaproteobacteria bacterium]
MVRLKHSPAGPCGPASPRPADPRRAVLILGVIAVLVFVVYSPSLKGPFLWDDEHLVVNNTYLRSWTHVPQILASDIANGAGREYDFWRPLQVLSYLVDFTLWKLNPAGYHVVNVLLHLLAASALFWLGCLIFADERPAVLAALFFAMHPAHTEAVSFVSGRADPLSLAFVLLAYCFLLKDGTPSRLYFFAGLGAYALALLARESALLLPVLVFLGCVTLGRCVSRRAWAGLLGVSVLYAALRLTVLRSIWPSEPLAQYTLAQRLPGAFAAFTGYLRVLLFPVGLHMEYGNRLVAWTDVRVTAGILAFCFFLGALFRKGTPGPVRFGLAWFLAALLPFLNVVAPLDATMAEHWLYLPSLGLFFILAWFLGRRWNAAPVASGAVAALLLLFWGASTFYHNRFWADPAMLFERIVKLAPQSTRARVSLALTYLGAERFEEAEKLLVESLKEDPRDYVAYNALGSLYYRMNRKADAEAAWRNGMAVEPRFGEFYSNLGVIEAEKGRLGEAIFFFKEAIKRNPRNADAYKNAAVACYGAGRYHEALDYWDKGRALGLREDPGLAQSMERARRQIAVTDI